MPRWVVHSKPLTAWRRLWGLNTDPTEVLSGVIPTAQVSKHWDSDVFNVWGMYVQGDRAAGAGVDHVAATLEAQRREVLVWRVDAWLERNGGIDVTPLHIFSPLQAYNPTANNTSIWFPWLQTPVEQPADPARLPEAFGLGGHVPGLQVVNINGVPFTCIGPAQSGLVGLFGGARMQAHWWFQDPPLHVRPFATLAVQTVLAVGGAGNLYTLNANFYYSEREDVGRVG